MLLANTVELMERETADTLLAQCDEGGRLQRALIRALQQRGVRQ